MRTDEEREHGLMDRRYLPPDRGMLFQFDRGDHRLLGLLRRAVDLADVKPRAQEALMQARDVDADRAVFFAVQE